MPFAPVTLTNGPSTVEYLVTGSGPGVVLVHGTFANAEANWAELMAELGERYTVVAPNYAGSGATAAPDTVTVDDLAAQVLAAADHAGLTSFHLAGHSLGAVAAAALAARHPERVNSLVLHAPWAATGIRAAAQFELWQHLLRTDPAALARLLPLTVLKPETVASWSAADFEDTVAAFAGLLAPSHAVQVAADRDADIRDLLPRITSATLVLASAQDQIVPIAEQREVAHAIPAAEYLEFDAGHALPLEDGPAFAKAITEFFDRHTDA
ncbi:alpha/beta fold hydrolase [Nocardia sp. CDC160]|uniref:alpha/beta fold hydrolase n=1 Tax=Nocardia sp. CDC160 TaxID=3112166 RepID=UPI002DB6786A|nr:alpha/beta hydrolase [Nocardia sp. CDC160]MEC3913444.1 alpha/beta hydrolase [Nocardia sp. CDC160]